MKVTIYIETSLAGPSVKDGGYGAVVEYITSKGEPETREVYGEEVNTTWNRSVLLAAVKALKILNRPCEVEIKTSCSFVANMLNNGNVDAWKRSEWKNSSGSDIKNKELWREFADLMLIHEISVVFCKHHAYKHSIIGKMIEKMDKNKSQPKTEDEKEGKRPKVQNAEPDLE